MSAGAVRRVWSPAFGTSLVRLAQSGVGIGAGSGAVTLAVLELLAGGPTDASWAGLFLGALVGGLLAVPVVVLSASTALLLAAHRPQRRGAVLAVLLVWPLLAAGVATSSLLQLSELGPVRQVVGLLVVLGAVALAVRATSRWVTDPLQRVPG